MSSTLGAIKEHAIDIDVQMFEQATILERKLDQQLQIDTFITSLEHVDNYKTILKSAGILMKMMAHA
jgi:hypothetical protein